jgi:hypothetical protein
MNKKGQTVFFSLIFAAMIFFVGMLVIDLMKDDVTTTRDNLQCTNMSISDGAKTTCLLVDWVIPYTFLLVFSLVGGLILSRFLI